MSARYAENHKLGGWSSNDDDLNVLLEPTMESHVGSGASELEAKKSGVGTDQNGILASSASEVSYLTDVFSEEEAQLDLDLDLNIALENDENAYEFSSDSDFEALEGEATQHRVDEDAKVM
jgi:hypothetical protein